MAAQATPALKNFHSNIFKHVVLLPTQWPRGLGREFSREVFHPKFLPEAFTFYRCSNSRLHQLCK